MKKKFAAFDIDGTFFRSHLYYEVVLELARQNKLHPELNKQTTELFEKWKNREYDKAFEVFDKTTIVAIDRLLTSLDPTEYDKIVNSVIKSKLNQTYTYTKKLHSDLKAKGYVTLAISGSRMEEVDIFAKYHNFDDWIGQKYVRSTDNKSYTGEVFKTYKDKHKFVQKFVKEHNLTYKDSYAIGDTGGDIQMLKLVDNPIAFNPNQELLEYAKKSGWKIVVERKSLIYSLERKDDRYVLA